MGFDPHGSADGLVLGAADEPDPGDPGKLMKASRQAGGETHSPNFYRRHRANGLHANEAVRRPIPALGGHYCERPQRHRSFSSGMSKTMDQNGRSKYDNSPCG